MEANKIELVELVLFVATKVSLKAAEVLTLIMFVVSKKIGVVRCVALQLSDQATTDQYTGTHLFMRVKIICVDFVS